MIARDPLDLLDEPRTRGDYQLASLYAQLDVARDKVRVRTLDDLIRKRQKVLDGLGVEEPEPDDWDEVEEPIEDLLDELEELAT